MASEETNAGEIKGLRQRIHDLAEAIHRQGLDSARHELEIEAMKDAVDKTATREQLAHAHETVTLKLGQVSADVLEVRRWIIAGVSIVMSAVILAIIALVIRGPQ